MNKVETFTLDGMDASVEESADALTYTFKPRENYARVGLPVGFLLALMVYPVGLLAIVIYAHSKVANRPEWEDVLTGVFVAQLLVWFLLGATLCYRMFGQWFRPSRTVLKFTREHLWHAGSRVCELEQVRGLRLFVYPASDKPPGATEACLSLVIGDVGHTHGLFGGFEGGALRAFAEGMHRRLTAFRFNQGLMTPPDALAVVETNEDEATKLMHTRPAPASLGRFGLTGAAFFLQNRWGGIAWCVAMLAGLFATARMIAATDLGVPFLFGHVLPGLIHFGLLMSHINGPQSPDSRAP